MVIKRNTSECARIMREEPQKCQNKNGGSMKKCKGCPCVTITEEKEQVEQ